MIKRGSAHKLAPSSGLRDFSAAFPLIKCRAFAPRLCRYRFLDLSCLQSLEESSAAVRDVVQNLEEASDDDVCTLYRESCLSAGSLLLLSREGWVSLKIPRGDRDGVGEVK